jgi:D-glycero-D-manno-heptose 1,7-bisphosphate phosphatase
MTLVLLDRDGVINIDSDEYVCSPAQFEPIPGSIEAIAQLVNAGYQVAVCTNQSGLGRGLFTERALTEIHAKLHGLLKQHGVALNALYY